MDDNSHPGEVNPGGGHQNASYSGGSSNQMDNYLYHVLACLKERPKNRTAKWSCKSELKLRQMLEQTAETQERHFYLDLIIPFS